VVKRREMMTEITAPVVKRKKNRKIQTGSYIVDLFIYIIIGFIAFTTLFPFIFILSASISNPLNVISGDVWFLPIGFSLKSYERIFSSATIMRAFGNSVFFAVIITFLNVLNSMMAGYALNKSKLVFRKSIVLIILLPMYFSGGLIPGFIIMSRLGLYNTLGAIILPSIVSIWNIILARTYIAGLPSSLREAAFIDGAGVLRIFISVILPLSKPMIAVLALYTALGAWNSWFNYMIYLPKLTQWQPLQLFLTKVLIWGNANATLSLGSETDPLMIQNKLLAAAVGAQLKYTVMVVASVPVICIYPFVQKFFIKGALLGSLKE
jgi:putative aldouronate transport system permease protein